MESFARRHIGPSVKERDTMLEACRVNVRKDTDFVRLVS